MQKALKIVAKIDKLNETIGKGTKYLLFIVMICLLIEVIARYVFNQPTIWVYDTTKQLLLVIGSLGGGYAFLYNANVKVDILYEHWSIKKRAIMDIITSSLFFLFMICLLIASIKMSIQSWVILERAPTYWAPPLYIIKTLVPIGCTFLILQGIASLIRNIIVLITGEESDSKRMNFT